MLKSTWQRFQVEPRLARAVECIWTSTGDPAGAPRERVVPSTGMSLIVNLGGDSGRIYRDENDYEGRVFRESTIWGPATRYAIRNASRRGRVIGVHFRPGMGGVVLGVPAAELTDTHVSLEDIWGQQARHLRECLMNAPSDRERVALIQQALRPPPMLMHPAIAHAIAQLNAGCGNIALLEQEAGYGPKRFIQLFTQQTGVVPKRFARIARFQAALVQAARGHADWAAIAADCGLCDQSHLNREFRAFAGITPSQYRPAAPDRPNHIAVP